MGFLLHRRPLALIVAALVAVTAAVALSSGLAKSQTGSGSPQPVAAGDVPSQFGVFKRPQIAADHPNPSLLGKLGSSTANPALARLAQTTSDGGRVYIIPTADGACLASSDFVEEGCATSADVSSGGSLQSVICAPSLPAGDVEIYGVLPDSAPVVKVTRADGSSSSVPVRGNTFIYRTAKNAPVATTLSWAGQSVPANLPNDVAKTQCDTSVSHADSQAASKAANQPSR